MDELLPPFPKHDVVVVNFINRKNEADQRVYQLLSEKFRLFEGVFGASDKVLGTIESGVDFEKRIAGIYQECRQNDVKEIAFAALDEEQERIRRELQHLDIEYVYRAGEASASFNPRRILVAEAIQALAVLELDAQPSYCPSDQSFVSGTGVRFPSGRS